MITNNQPVYNDLMDYVLELEERIKELEAGLEAATAELEMQLCIRWDCTHDEIRAVNKYVIAARALLAQKG